MDEQQSAEETLHEMRRELIETRNLSIKADHALRGLTTEMKQLGRRLEAGERRTALNSIASYVLFAALSFAGMFLFFRAAIERNEVDHRLVEEKQEQNQRRLADLEAEIERRRQSERESYAFLELLQSGRRDEVVSGLPRSRGGLPTARRLSSSAGRWTGRGRKLHRMPTARASRPQRRRVGSGRAMPFSARSPMSSRPPTPPTFGISWRSRSTISETGRQLSPITRQPSTRARCRGTTPSLRPIIVPSVWSAPVETVRAPSFSAALPNATTTIHGRRVRCRRPRASSVAPADRPRRSRSRGRAAARFTRLGAEPPPTPDRRPPFYDRPRDSDGAHAR